MNNQEVNSRLGSFCRGQTGKWRVTGMMVLVGERLPAVSYLDMVSGSGAGVDTEWILQGVMSNECYVTRSEKGELVKV